VPTYEYGCTACGHRFDAVQRFTDEALTECPECGGALRKVYGAVGIVLKGSGFYKTDTRAAANGSNGSGTTRKETAGDSSSSGSEAGSNPGSDSGSTSGSGASDKSGGSEKKDSKSTAPAPSGAG
jgi:putative FmdB family regulatory protein